jgi:hypothetical protein
MSQAAVPQSRRHPCHFQQQGSLSVFGCVSSTRASCLSCHRRPKCRLRLPPCRRSRGSRASRNPVVAHDYHRPIGGDLKNVVVEMGEDADKGTRRLFVAARLWLFFGGTFGPRVALSIHRPARGTSSDAVVSGGVPSVFGEIRRRLRRDLRLGLIGGLGRAFSPHRIIGTLSPGRCPRLGWGRAFGPRWVRNPQFRGYPSFPSSIHARAEGPSNNSRGHRPRQLVQKKR